MSYTIPKGVQRGNEVELSDKTYDGHEDGERLVGGLGQLVDGQKGMDNFRTDVHGFGKGKNNFNANSYILSIFQIVFKTYECIFDHFCLVHTTTNFQV